MIRHSARLQRFTLVMGLVSVAITCFPSPNDAQVNNEPVRFDVPALVAACEIVPLDPASLTTGEQIIEIVLPVSCWVTPEEREVFREFRFDVHWNRSIYPLVDYSPHTLMQSPVNGVIAIEQRNEKSLKTGVDAKSPALSIPASASLSATNLDSDTTHFEEIPQHEMLVASGTIHRGTGAFFRYHPSRQYALEGGREVSLMYRVPRSWRGGLMRVSCQANGQRKRFGGFHSPVSVVSEFIVAIHAKQDAGARDIAAEYIRSEQQLRSVWRQEWQSRQQAQPRTFLAQFHRTGRESSLPESWALDLILSPVDTSLQQDRARLPASVQLAADEFVKCRNQLIDLSLRDGTRSAAGMTQSSWQTRSPTSVVE